MDKQWNTCCVNLFFKDGGCSMQFPNSITFMLVVRAFQIGIQS